jgi:Mlc titration factor MtfA (ptsG expression regulator)
VSSGVHFLDPLIAVCGIAFGVIVVLVGPPLWRARRGRQLRAQSLPADWRGLVERAMPLYSRIPQPLRARLDGLIQQFMAEKEFVGCRGLTVTVEMKLAVAAPACLLVLNRPGPLYEELFSVLLYPDVFVVPEEDHDDSGVVTLH